MAAPLDIVEAAEAMFAPQDLLGWRVVVTAGPTREHLDPVRFISNPSTGRMGYAVARAAAQRGARVLLVSGPCELPAPQGVEMVRVTCADEMAEAALRGVKGAQLFVAAAAVADQKPEYCAKQKVKKREGPEILNLVRTPDILASASASAVDWQARPIFVGFAAETENVVEHAREKLTRKNIDLIAANDVTEQGSGFGELTNRLTLVDSTGEVTELLRQSKEDAAHALLDRVLAFRSRRLNPMSI